MFNKKASLILALLILNITSFLYCQDNKEKAKEYYQQGDIYYQQGMYKEAEERYQKALSLLEEDKKTAPLAEEYIISAEDELAINVWQNANLSQESVTVRPDGKITCFLIGEVQVAGRTIPQVQQEIEERLKEYIKYPKVSIAVRRVGGKRILILGEIQQPGIHELTSTKTILELIGKAGGFTPDSVASSVLLIRGELDKPKVKRLNLTKALKGDLRQNVVLQAGDIIFVPKKFIANLNYFVTMTLGPILSSTGAYTDLRDFNRKK